MTTTFKLSRRSFISAGVAAACIVGRYAFGSSGDPTLLSIYEASGRIRSGELSPVTLTCAYLERIARIDVKINAYITVLGDLALEQARGLESELKAGRWRGPLHGIPIAPIRSRNTIER